MNRATSICLIFISFLLIFASVSLLNHFLVRTETLDLGLFNNVLWDYAHLQFNYSECLNTTGNNFLHDHFDLYLVLFSPFSYLFKSYTLLIIQIVAILFGGFGIYKVCEHLTNSFYVQIGSLLLFFIHFGIYSALSFGYHSNVVASMLIPWFIYFALKKKWKWLWFFTFCILIGKENMSIILVFVCFGLMLLKTPLRTKAHLFIISFVSMFYFYGMVEVVLPSLSNTEKFVHFRYEVLGESSLEALKNLLSEPFYYLKFLILNQSTNEISIEKVEFWQYLAAGGGVLLLFRPQFIVMLIPIVFQKMFNSRMSCWGIYHQYSIEVVSIVVIGVTYVLNNVRNHLVKGSILFATLLVSGFLTYSMIQEGEWNRLNIKSAFYNSSHYTIPFNRNDLTKSLEKIPNDASVTGTSKILTQLSFRDNAYRLSKQPKGNFFVWFKYDNPYPLSIEELKALIKRLEISNNWIKIEDNSVISIYKHLVD